MSFLSISLHVKSLEVSGLSSFNLKSTVYNPDSSEFKIFFNLPTLHVKSNFSWSSEIDVAGELKMSHIDDGSIDAHFKLPQDLGFSFVFFKDETTGNLTTKDWKLYEPKINWKKDFSFLEEHKEIFNEFKELVDEIHSDLKNMIIEHIQEHFNKIVVNYKDVEHITLELNKASGDEHTGPFGDKLCVH